MPPQTCLQTKLAGAFSQLRFPSHTSLACTKLAKPAQPVCPQRPESRSTRYELGVFLPLLSTVHMSVHGAVWGSLFFFIIPKAKKCHTDRPRDSYYGTRRQNARESGEGSPGERVDNWRGSLSWTKEQEAAARAVFTTGMRRVVNAGAQLLFPVSPHPG